jgi:hypothetical protein
MDVEELLAKQEISEVIYRYCRGIDRMDRELTLSCWHPDGTADYGEIYRGTGAGFVDWLWPVHRDGFAAHSHQITNMLIELDGARAASESYVTVALRSRGTESAVDLIARGRYLDRWSRRDGVWAIDHRRHLVDMQSSYPASAGDGEPMDGSSRGPDDASYELLPALS